MGRSKAPEADIGTPTPTSETDTQPSQPAKKLGAELVPKRLELLRPQSTKGLRASFRPWVSRCGPWGNEAAELPFKKLGEGNRRAIL